jgi:hypothetical protein
MRAGLVYATEDGDGHPAYALTQAGKSKAALVRAITEAVARCQGDPPDGTSKSSQAA